MLLEIIVFLNDNVVYVEFLIIGNIIMLLLYYFLFIYYIFCSIVLGYLVWFEGRFCCSKVIFGNKELFFFVDEERWVDWEICVLVDIFVFYLFFIFYMNIWLSCILNLFVGMFLLFKLLIFNEDLRNFIYNFFGYKF